MQVRMADHLGMCFGVRDAIDLALDLTRQGPLTILGDLVHNPDVVAQLAGTGLTVLVEAGAGAAAWFDDSSYTAAGATAVFGIVKADVPLLERLFSRTRALKGVSVKLGTAASVAVGGLLASTLSMSTDDFMSGRYILRNSGAAGSIVNQGSIRSGQRGYIAFVGPSISNVILSGAS